MIEIKKNKKIRVGICGYGNLGRGVELAVLKAPDMVIPAIFTRREPSSITTISGAPVIPEIEAPWWVDKIDAMIMCGGSRKDLPVQVPKFARFFNVVDSFDTHDEIKNHWNAVNEQAIAGGKIAIISNGWDPGIDSLFRELSNAIDPDAEPGDGIYCFYGKGISQGHSDAIRQIEGVKDARQYTIPIPEALNAVKAEENPKLSKGQQHRRVCFVVAKKGADRKRIEQEIVTMKDYFEGYETTVYFISQKKLNEEHGSLYHRGDAIANITTGNGNKHQMELILKLSSNPEFTGAFLTAAARAAYRMNEEGQVGAKTIDDVPLGMLSHKTREERLERFI